VTRLAGRPPQPRSELVEHGRRIDDLYRRIKGEDRPEPWVEVIPFSAPGAFAVNVEGVSTPKRGHLLAEVELLLVTAGSSTTTVTIYKNGVSQGTASLASSDDGPTPTAFEVVFSPRNDRLGAKVTTKGTGSAGLTINCHFL